MGDISLPEKAVIFCGVLYNRVFQKDDIENILRKYFGNIILRSEIFEFTETSYYNDEMGKPIFRVYYAFDHLIDMDRIVECKILGNWIENEYFLYDNGKRAVNIDPGYLNLAKVVLATTKNFQHRIYLRNGIYSEVTLRWRRGSFSEWEWTYKDYKREESIRFFNELRNLYRSMIELK